MLLSIITIVCAFFAGILAGLVDKAQSKFPKAKYKAFWDFLYQHRLWLRLGAVSLSILAYALGVTALYSNVPYPHVPFIAPAVICFFLLLLGYTTIHIKTFLQLRSYKNIFENIYVSSFDYDAYNKEIPHAVNGQILQKLFCKLKISTKFMTLKNLYKRNLYR